MTGPKAYKPRTHLRGAIERSLCGEVMTETNRTQEDPSCQKCARLARKLGPVSIGKVVPRHTHTLGGAELGGVPGFTLCGLRARDQKLTDAIPSCGQCSRIGESRRAEP